jgi:hypothetical protein
MRVFDHPNMTNFKCPICHTSDDKPVVLIGIQGTKEGNIIEARQYHLECIELLEMDLPYNTIIYQQFDLIKDAK